MPIYFLAGGVFLAELSLISALVGLIMWVFRLRWWPTFRWFSCLLAGLSFGMIGSSFCLSADWPWDDPVSPVYQTPVMTFLRGLTALAVMVGIPICLGGLIGLIGHSAFWGRLSRPELFRTGQGKTGEAENRKPLQNRLKRR